MTTTALGIDPAVRNTGIALLEIRGTRVDLVANATLRASEPLQAIHGVVAYLLGQDRPDVTGIECLARTVHGNSTRKTTTYAATWVREISGAAYGAARALGLNPIFVEPQDWRSSLGLQATASKALVAVAVRSRVGQIKLSEHESDAVGIAIRAAAEERVRRCSGRRVAP